MTFGQDGFDDGSKPALSLLIVDDSEADRELASIALKAVYRGADIQHCADPRTAERTCDEQDFDCVVLDYNMPQMDGLALASRLRERFAHLPIILMTNFGDEMLVGEALRGGVSDYLPKVRISPHSFRRTVDRSIQACAQARIIDEQRGELENFAYALAHDFKQPIRQISTFTQLIADQIRDGGAEDVQSHLAFLGDAARRLSRLVDVMVEYTLLNHPPAIAEFSLGDALDSVRSSIKPYLAERGGQFVAPTVTPRMRGNETLMIQVLQNLVINGLMYNKSAVPRVEVTVSAHPDFWHIEVVDNGLGIEGDYLAEIFKPLFRLHTASDYAGSGLGLTLARKAVLAQNGAIWCDSTPGAGAVFHIHLPVTKPAGARRTRRQTPRPV